ncbi:MAG: TIGR03943 family protein [Chloroflexota bacterium]|jgi:uncharacterized repeat protein (TIGR03943 family)
MNLRLIRSFQAMVLIGLGFYLLSRVWSGQVLLYINQRFVALVFFAGISFVVLAQIILRERNDMDPSAPPVPHASWRWNLWWLILPVLVGFLIPARPLSPSVVENRGINTSAPITARIEDNQAILSLASTERTVLDWIRLFSLEEDAQRFEGEAVDVIGFVFTDGRLTENQFMIGRFTITCCVADAMALGIVVEYPGVQGLINHAWVRVQGEMTVSERDGKQLPLIRAERIEVVPQPEQPYLFP